MSLIFTNRFVPAEYLLSLSLSDAKPNYSGKVRVRLSSNDRYSTDTSQGSTFSVTLNTAEVISMSCVLKSGDRSWKLSHSLNKDSQTTEYFSPDVQLENLKDTNDLYLEVNFLGVIRKIMTYDDVTKGVFATKYMDPVSGKSDLFFLSTHSQPHFARYIFPCLDDINSKCPIQLELSVDNKFTCVSNLPIESSEFISNTSNKLVKFVRSPPMSMSVFSFAVGNLDYLESEADMLNGKLPVRVYTMVGESERAKFALSTVTNAISTIEKKFGIAYPLPKLDIIATPFLSDGGVENWSMIQVINDHILLPDWQVTESSLANTEKMITDVLVHELIHMYVGNYVTFDSYDHTWLNEAFATFMSTSIINEIMDNNNWYNFINKELSPMKNNNMRDESKAIYQSNVKTSSISETFTRNSYDKGIFVIRTLASLFVETTEELDDENYDVFFAMVGDFIKLHKFGHFKPVDLWNFMKNHTSNKFSYDIPTIMNSWIRTPGFPILKVSKEGDNLKIEQHHYLESIDAEIEDIPFHIPLLFKKLDGSLGRQLISDRCITISKEEDSDFLFVNANNAVIANIVYPETMAKEIASNFSILNRTEQMQFFMNFASVIGTDYQTNESIVSFFKVIRSIKKIKQVNPAAMTFALSILSNVYKSINTLAYFEDESLFKRINHYVDELISKYASQLDLENTNWTKLSHDEIQLRNAVLSLKYDNSSIQLVGKKLYKKLMHGPKESIPSEIVNSVLAIVAQSYTLKEYKEISKLVRNPGLVSNNIIGQNSNEVQTAAINALGCSKDPELRYKTLMFVTTNPDVKLIELALLGLRFQMSAYEQLWKWYVSHYTTWYSKFARDNSSYQGLFFKHVSELALECAYYNPDLRPEVESFVTNKNENVQKWFEEAKGKFENIKFLSKANFDLKLCI